MDIGDCTWSKSQVLLLWAINMVNMNLFLPPHREMRFQEILSSIPCTKNQVGIDKWHNILGDFQSMEFTLTGARGFFIQIQESIRHLKLTIPTIQIQH